jgi:hypothetical protein
MGVWEYGSMGEGCIFKWHIQVLPNLKNIVAKISHHTNGIYRGCGFGYTAY